VYQRINQLGGDRQTVTEAFRLNGQFTTPWEGPEHQRGQFAAFSQLYVTQTKSGRYT